MRLLVTGGSGFLGSHLVELAHERGASVSVLDDLSTGAAANLDALEGSPRLRLHVGSALDPERVEPLVREADAVLHLAATVGVLRVLEQPVQGLENNVRATEVVLGAAARHRRPVLYASSSEVYGKGPVPFREGADVSLGPAHVGRWSYGAAKALGEWLALAHARERGVAVSVARIFNTVGPRQVGRYGMVLPRFCAQALAGEPISVYGTGRQTRCFAHVRDTVRALLQLVERSLERPWPSPAESIFNVGSDREVSIGELAEIVRRESGADAPIERVPYERVYGEGFEDLPRRVPDLGRLRATGWTPSVSLEGTVCDVLADLRRRGARVARLLPTAAANGQP